MLSAYQSAVCGSVCERRTRPNSQWNALWDAALPEILPKVLRSSLYESIITFMTVIRLELINCFVLRWREVLGARKKLRRQMRGFPAAPGLMGHSGTLKALIPSAMQNLQTQPKGIVNLGNAGKLFVSFIRWALCSFFSNCIWDLHISGMLQKMAREDAPCLHFVFECFEKLVLHPS